MGFAWCPSCLLCGLSDHPDSYRDLGHEEHKEPQRAQRFFASFAMFLCALCGRKTNRRERKVLRKESQRALASQKGCNKLIWANLTRFFLFRSSKDSY